MSSVVLVNPKLGKNRNPHPDNYAAREPLSILTLGSYLKNAGIEAKLIDAVLYEEEKVIRIISNFIKKGPKPVLIGFSVMTTQISHALELSDFVKSIDPSIPIVWGGVHPTLFAEETSLDDSVDIVVHGRGELPLLEIWKQLTNEKETDNDIPGTCIKGKFNKAEKPLNMSEYPFLDYELLDLKRYLGPLPHYLLSEKANRALQVISSRGCPWRCGYCINKVTGNQWTPLSSERYLNELAANVKRFKLDAYRVMDEDFFVSKRRTFEIVEGLLDREITLPWGANIRANYFRNDYVSVDFAKELRDTGCKFLSLGAESGNQRILNLITKDITVEQLIHSAEVCREADIIPIYSWMIGIPSQTKEEIYDTIKIMLQISRICPSAIHYPFWIFRPFPGGSLYDLCVRHGLRVPATLRDWSEMGADEDLNTGFYNVGHLPWIKDTGFVEFLGKNVHEVSNIVNRAFKRRVKAKLIYFIIFNWGTHVGRINLIFLKIAINLNRIFKPITKVVYELKRNGKAYSNPGNPRRRCRANRS